jgi:cytochrome c oxidase subunit IV
MAKHSVHEPAAPSGQVHPIAHDPHHTHSAHDVSKEVRKYLMVFGALLIGTILTVWASYINFGTPAANIIVALVIASVKATLVAAFFMHLVDEKKLVYGVLGATVFFFVGLMYLTLWSSEPTSFIHLRR